MAIKSYLMDYLMNKRLKIYRLVNSYCEELSFLGRSKQSVYLKKRRLMKMIDIAQVKKVKEYNGKTVKYIRDCLYKCPSNSGKIREFKGMNIEQIIEKNKTLKYQILNETTVEGYISALRDFFCWLVHEGEVEKNPVSDLKLKRRKLIAPHKKRSAFSDEDLENMFELNFLKKGNYSNGFRFWILPLLRLNGGRLGEFIQLESKDFETIDGVFCMHLYPDEYKTNNSGRTIPVHPRLIDMGIKEFIKVMDGELFPETRKYQKCRTDGVSKWAQYWRKKIGLGKGKDLHSFRHTFINELKQKNVPRNKIAYLVGHASDVTLDLYGKPYPQSVLFEVINKIDSSHTLNTATFE